MNPLVISIAKLKKVIIINLETSLERQDKRVTFNLSNYLNLVTTYDFTLQKKYKLKMEKKEENVHDQLLNNFFEHCKSKNLTK